MINSVYKDAEGTVYIRYTKENTSNAIEYGISMTTEEAKELINMLTHCLERK